MLHLFDGDLVAILLSVEVIFAVIFAVSLLIAVHSLVSFFQRSGSLYTRLAEIEAEMSVLQASIPGKLENIRARRAALQPLTLPKHCQSRALLSLPWGSEKGPMKHS